MSNITAYAMHPKYHSYACIHIHTTVTILCLIRARLFYVTFNAGPLKENNQIHFTLKRTDLDNMTC